MIVIEGLSQSEVLEAVAAEKVQQGYRVLDRWQGGIKVGRSTTPELEERTIYQTQGHASGAGLWSTLHLIRVAGASAKEEEILPGPNTQEAIRIDLENLRSRLARPESNLSLPPTR
jgi:hypothetical protein